jgi:hypothetical protein
MHSPNLAGQRMIELNKVANRVWKTHFRDRPAIKGSAVQIFEQLSTFSTLLAAKNEVCAFLQSAG